MNLPAPSPRAQATAIYTADLAPYTWTYGISVSHQGQQHISLDVEIADLVPHFLLCCMGPPTPQHSFSIDAQLVAARAKFDTIRTSKPADYDFLVTSARQWAQELCFRDWAMKGFPRTTGT